MPKPDRDKIPPGKNKNPNPPPPPPPPTPAPGQRIVLDPVTRIEGHLRIETEVSDGKVSNAWSSGTLFRGIETILNGREPEDAWLFTQRLCGVCTYVHGSSSVRCVEDALRLAVPDNARIIRNLLMGVQFVQDHIVHFYHLHALDWVDIVSALSADTGETARLAKELSPSAEVDFVDVQKKLQTFVDSGKLGPFAGGYWGHPAYLLSREENLLLAAHYLEALRQQAVTARMHAIFGAKNPHLQTLRVGGVTCRDDIIPSRIEEFRTLLSDTKAFVDNFYIPDVALLADAYKEPWSRIGGNNNFLCYGEFPETSQEQQGLFFPSGVIFNKNQLMQLNTAEILEHVTHSWYQGNVALHPFDGETLPNYTNLNTSDRYSWLKAPRYAEQPMEVGPLARILVAYLSDKRAVVEAVNGFLTSVGLEPDSLYSTLGRTAARALETQLITDAMFSWIDDLTIGASAFTRPTMVMTGEGMGLNEAPRGALGHWIRIENQKIGNYQMVVPSTWNFGPRCASGKLGPAEQALIGTPIADPAKPVEVLRTVHSLDPCIACAVHVIEPGSDRVYQVRVI